MPLYAHSPSNFQPGVPHPARHSYFSISTFTWDNDSLITRRKGCGLSSSTETAVDPLTPLVDINDIYYCNPLRRITPPLGVTWAEPLPTFPLRLHRAINPPIPDTSTP